MLTRRDFVGAGVALGVGLASSGRRAWAEAPTTLPAVTQPTIPRWRGFNLLERFSSDWGPPKPFEERDFEATAEWGFDFLRIPMDYRFWGSQKDYFEIREADLAEVDRVVDLGRQYGLHINLNFHRAPGYCVNEPKEPTLLWEDDKAMDACAKHWAHFAARYKGRPSSELSFNLINEPGDKVSVETYARFTRRMCRAIREVDPDRLIVADGARWGQLPVWELWDQSVVQSGRGYLPFGLTHYKASWIKGSDTWSVPTWPGDGWDRKRLHDGFIVPFRDYVRRGGAVHMGEFGCLNFTAHEVTLAWMSDQLGLWKEQNWGWALWNLRGGFGVADSSRSDVNYETYKGMKLDRKMLELLRAS